MTTYLMCTTYVLKKTMLLMFYNMLQEAILRCKTLLPIISKLLSPDEKLLALLLPAHVSGLRVVVRMVCVECNFVSHTVQLRRTTMAEVRHAWLRSTVSRRLRDLQPNIKITLTCVYIIFS